MELWKFMVIWLTVILFASMFAAGALMWFCSVVETGERVLGDVNGDGKVNVLDVIRVLVNMGPVPPSPPECDINGDGVVNIMDVIKLLIIRIQTM